VTITTEDLDYLHAHCGFSSQLWMLLCVTGNVGGAVKYYKIINSYRAIKTTRDRVASCDTFVVIRYCEAIKILEDRDKP